MIRSWGHVDRRRDTRTRTRAPQTSRALSGVVLATVHVPAGKPRGLQLAHGAVTAAAKLSSTRVRTRLVPLAAALEARPGTDLRQLARMARQVATMHV